jgi:threonine aldolase
MIQYNFKNDYSEGAHPRILKALTKTNLNQEEGYGQDSYCIEAIEVIRQKIKNPNADIHFVSGGTQANLIVIASILKPYESVIATDTGHIAVHEAGAIESTGHKVNIVETKNGKLNPQNIESVITLHKDEHMVKPKLVFISNSTETGNIYYKNELEELSCFCKQNKLFLYLDGARLGSALTSEQNDLTLSELSKYLDIFYIGGTKNGALLGEGIVINNEQLKENFRFHLKQKGALLAKGKILGIQFLELFKDDLFFKLGKHANLMAAKISKSIKDLDYKFLTDPVSNQIFPILPNELIEELSKKYKFYVWSKINDHNSAIRLVTSWATKEEIVDTFISELKKNNGTIKINQQ